jgi:hypothetical protein
MEPVPAFGGACVRAAEDNCMFFSCIAAMPMEIDCRGEFWSVRTGILALVIRAGVGLILVRENPEVETYAVFARAFSAGCKEASIAVAEREEAAREEAGGVELPGLVAPQSPQNITSGCAWRVIKQKVAQVAGAIFVEDI